MSSSVLELLEAAAQSKTRVTFLNREVTSCSVGELWRAAGERGQRLTNQVGSEGCVGAVLASSPDCVATLMGAWRAGLSLASLPYPSRGMDLAAYSRQLKSMCLLVGADLLLVEESYLPFLADLGVPVGGFGGGEVRKPARLRGGSGEFVQFTSGSAGEPKGVRLSMNALGANIASILEVLDPSPTDSACSWLPLSHDMGLIGMCLASLVSCGPPWNCTGGLTLIAPEQFLAHPRVWLETCSDLGTTITAAPNFAFDLTGRLLHEGTGGLDLSKLRVCITGGELIRAGTLRRFTTAAGPHGFRGVAFCPAYGIAEATLAVTMVWPSVSWQSVTVDANALGEGRWVEVDDGQGREILSCGEPLPGIKVQTGDDSGGRIGQIEIHGPSLLDGYVTEPAPLTDEGWFTTQDLGRLLNGELYITGRGDDVVLVAGRNLYAVDIESAVARHGLVRPGNCAVIPDGRGRYAIITERAREAGEAGMREAARLMRGQLVKLFPAAPSQVVFIQRGSLPKTPSGKVQRHRLEESFRRGTLEVECSVRFKGRVGAVETVSGS